MRTRDACSCEVGFGMFGGSLLLLQLSLVEDNDIPSSEQFRVSQLRVCINCMIRSLYGLGRDHTAPTRFVHVNQLHRVDQQGPGDAVE